jgi:putative component of membrane protein insertase Oxa1/YidC/SpoIIIJ protein YidD
MILAVKKYGSIKGVFMGLKRICRCHAPNDGEDYP